MAESGEDDDVKILSSATSMPAAVVTSIPNRSEGSPLGLGDADIEQNVYEGGFKSWEGAMDLALLLLDKFVVDADVESDRSWEADQVVELGCGTALPSLVLFAAALKWNRPLRLTLADYNTSVLRLVTLPNVLLTWALHCAPEAFSPSPPSISEDCEVVENGEGELEITPALLKSFTASIASQKLELTFLSGPWSPKLNDAVPIEHSKRLAILAAETIYQPTSLPAFVDTVVNLLNVVDNGFALVAAKKVYFGVGGSVEDFVTAAARRNLDVVSVDHGSKSIGYDSATGGGVARWIGKVTKRT